MTDKKETRGRKKIPVELKKKVKNVYLNTIEERNILKKHSSLTAAILTTIDNHKK